MSAPYDWRAALQAAIDAPIGDLATPFEPTARLITYQNELNNHLYGFPMTAPIYGPRTMEQQLKLRAEAKPQLYDSPRGAFSDALKENYLPAMDAFLTASNPIVPFFKRWLDEGCTALSPSECPADNMSYLTKEPNNMSISNVTGVNAAAMDSTALKQHIANMEVALKRQLEAEEVAKVRAAKQMHQADLSSATQGLVDAAERIRGAINDQDTLPLVKEQLVEAVTLQLTHLRKLMGLKRSR